MSDSTEKAQRSPDDGRRTSSRVTREGRVRRTTHRRREHTTSRRGGDNLLDEVLELQQGVLRAGVEVAGATLDTATRVARNSVDRAFSQDFRHPGDLVRNVGRDTEDTVRDVIDGMRDVPRRMNDGFYDVVRPASRVKDRGERHRRADAAEDDE